MTIQTRTVLWATAIIVVAIFLSASDLSNGARLGIIAGLAGAAIGATSGRKAKRKGCC